MPALLMPMSSVTLRDPFWIAWQRALFEKGLAHQYEQCETTGRFENFERAARGESSGHTGYFFNDSDIYKWLEAASYALHIDPTWEGASMVDRAIDAVAHAQEDDGYIGTPFQLDHKGKRWRSLTAKHEMYCIGHLIEAGVAHVSVNPSSKLYNVAQKAADHVVASFGPGKRNGYCGHQEIELAFCRLSEASGNDSYRELAKWMTESRGSRPSPFLEEFSDPVGKELNVGYLPLVFPEGEYNGAYFQDDLPLRDQSEAVGHAVRAMYYYCGAVDSCDDPKVFSALTTIWSNLVRKKMYVTGGIGSSGRNEGFTTDFDLPNRDAYSETCAAIGLVFWASRMSRLMGDSRYADVMELALYNAALGGINLDTDKYFYVNPLESRGDHLRKPWFGCACCPPNIARLLLSVQRYGAYWNDQGLTVDVPFSADYEGAGGTVRVESGWPYRHQVSISVPAGGSLKIRLRIPSWSAGFTSSHKATEENGYLVADRDWSATDAWQVEFNAEPEWLWGDDRVADTIGRRALRKGPIIYCLEEVDLGAPVHLFRPETVVPIREIAGENARVSSILQVSGQLEMYTRGEQLYYFGQSYQEDPCVASFVPYFSWANREPGSMAVWHRPC